MKRRAPVPPVVFRGWIVVRANGRMIPATLAETRDQARGLFPQRRTRVVAVAVLADETSILRLLEAPQ